MSAPPPAGAIVASWFDGQDAGEHAAHLYADADALVLQVADRDAMRLGRADIVWIPSTSAPRPTLRLGDGSTLVLPSPAAAATLGIPQPGESRIERAWRSPLLAGMAAAGSVALAAFALAWGLPHASEFAVSLTPWETEVVIGNEALKDFDRLVAKPSQLPPDVQQRTRARFAVLADSAGLAGTRLEFRSAPRIGPNAFALPGRIVVVTDALVETLGDSRALEATLAHELGHVQHRHGARALLRKSEYAAILAVLMHDARLQARLAKNALQGFLEAAHSRDAELEADAFALTLLARTGGSPADLVDALAKLRADRARAGGEVRAHYLSTHPSSEERIDAARRTAGP